MGDDQGQDAVESSGAVRLIGDHPYLLVEFIATGRDVEIALSSDRITCDGTLAGFIFAMQEVIKELQSG